MNLNLTLAVSFLHFDFINLNLTAIINPHLGADIVVTDQ